MINTLLREFRNPSPEFSPLPFWFLNDTLTREELLRQIDDFHAKGVDGFVLHPRMGLPKEPEYLSPAFMDLMEVCIKRAAELDMTVVLYDEASYPSGSCHGKVPAENPLYASRRLHCRRLEDCSIGENEWIFRRFALCGEQSMLLEDGQALPDGWEGYALVECPTHGHIRGIHAGEDDGQPDAPLSGDLLNPDAVACFIRLTHQAWYDRFAPYFGKTIIGFFTDEPSISGRGGQMRDSLSWTGGFLDDFLAAGGTEAMLPALFRPLPESGSARAIYAEALRNRLECCYYAQLSDWCVSHGIALMGHPAESGDMDSQRYFQIPGQDLVWRYVAPELPLDTAAGIIGKCSSDAARMLGTRRNSNEVLGVCGAAGNPWDFTASDMLWYFNYLFARGVNMIIPHAFYYSVRTPLQSDERPPDVGPNNIWWEDYRLYSDYIKRMCRLNTDALNHPYAALLCDGQTMPQRCAVGLYERQIDFNYLDQNLLPGRAEIHDGNFTVGDYRYSLLLVGCRPNAWTEAFLADLEKAGVAICREGDFAAFVTDHAEIRESFTPACPQLRLTHLTREGADYLLLINEGFTPVSGTLTTPLAGRCLHLDPMTGEAAPLAAEAIGDKQAIRLTVQPRVASVLLFNPDQEPLTAPEIPRPVEKTVPVQDNRFTLPDSFTACRLEFDQVHDQCDVTVNGQYAGRMRFIPWTLDITPFVHPGENVLDLAVKGSMANIFGKPVETGVTGTKIIVE